MALTYGLMAALATMASLLVSQYFPGLLLRGSLPLTVFALLCFQRLVNSIWTMILWPKIFSPLRNLPGPKNGNFLLGQFLHVIKKPTGEPAREWLDSVDNDGLISYSVLFNAERVLLASPEALREVLVTKNYEFIKPEQIRKSISSILGVGVLLAEGDEHKRQRKNLMPAFAFRHIKDLYPIFWAKARESTSALIGEFHRYDGTNGRSSMTVEIGGWASRATLDIIGKAGMGHDFNSIQNPNGELTRAYQRVFDPGKVGRALQILGFFLPLWFLRGLPVQRNTDMREAAATIKQTCLRLIQEKRRRLEKGEQTDYDILSVALESGGFSDDDLVNQLMTFLAAGHETTATAMTWTILMLCRNPEMQTRLREELRGALPSLSDPSKSISSTDIDSLPYLNAVCNESLRFYPPVPLTLRKAAHDTTILGNPIPKGTTIVISPWAINQSIKIWGPDAKSFNPDRWIDPATGHTNNMGGADSNFSFLTFLHGPRSCIGQSFAKAEFACLLAAYVGRFEMELVEPDKKFEIKGGITARPKGGLMVRLKPIDGW